MIAPRIPSAPPPHRCGVASALRLLRRRWLGVGAAARRDLLVPTLVVLGVTALAMALDLDRLLQRPLFDAGAWPRSWPVMHEQPWWFLYEFASTAMAVAAVGLIGGLAIAYRLRRLRRYRMSILYVILVLLIGPGVLVNLTLKENWGRPRPRQTLEFGGRWAYRDVLSPGQPGKGKSFPCGHATVGFSLFAGYFLFRDRRPRIARGCWIAALVTGGLLGYARMAGGAHFATDVLWSGYLLFAVAWGLYHLVLTMPYRLASANEDLLAPSATWLGAATLVVVGIAGGTVAATPFYEEVYRDAARHGVPVPDRIDLSVDRGQVIIELGAPRPSFVVHGLAEGFGPGGNDFKGDLILATNDTDGVVFAYSIRSTGFFTEFQATVRLTVPDAMSGVLAVTVGEGDVEVVEAGPFRGRLLLAVSDGRTRMPERWQHASPEVEVRGARMRGPPEALHLAAGLDPR